MKSLRQLFSRSARVADADVADEPGSSLHAIRRKRAADGGELAAHVYRYAERKFLVTSIMSVPGSLSLETGEPSTLSIGVTDEELGRVVCEHLLGHVAQEPSNLRGRKLSDWAVFTASGDRSRAGFESKSFRVSVETVNLAIELDAAPMRSLSELSITAYSPPRHSELGAKIRKTLDAVDALRRAGLM